MEGIGRCNLIGFLTGYLGLGEAGRGFLRALESAGITPELIDVTHNAPTPQDLSLVSRPVRLDLPPAEFNLFCINADTLINVGEQLRLDLQEGSAYTIGNWAWETKDIPKDWLPAFDLVDELWVGSNFISETIKKKSPVPVIKIPYVVDVPLAEPDRTRFGLREDEFVVLFSFDFQSSTGRKNPRGAIDAFKQAFHGSENARLVMKTLNAHIKTADAEALMAYASDPRITFINESLDSQSRYQLLNSCDVYLSLHRAEGFGLGMAEAMSYGKVVVATGWSGNMDFMTPQNSVPVPFVLRPSREASGPYKKGSLWAEPSIKDAAGALQRLYSDREWGTALGKQAILDMKASFSSQVVGKMMADRLRVLAGLDGGVRHVPKLPKPRVGLRYAPRVPVPGLKQKLLKDLARRPFFYLSRIPKAVVVLSKEGPEGLKQSVADLFRPKA
jgi:glycosyltransferase involved in cell wall biosynthesis